MKLFTILFSVLLACSGCRDHSAYPATTSTIYPPTHDTATTEQLRELLKTVIVTDGISQTDAVIIGECYFRQNVGCGAFTGISDGGDRWIVEAQFGYAGDRVKGFSIDKRSGKVSSPVGPSYDNPLKIFP